MKELFNNIISVQFGASIAIVLLLLSRKIMKKRYVAKLRYWLWLIIALRLCLPVDINIQLNRIAPVNIPVNDYYITAQQPQIAGQPTEFEIITADRLNSQPVENTENTAEIPPVIKTFSVADMLYKIWLAVATLLGAISVISYFLAKRDIMSTAFYENNLTAYMENLKKQMGINKKVKIAVCHYTGSPMLVGLFNPVIVLPDTDYTPTQLEMIIRHELTHLKRNDIFYKFILHLVSCVYWFNPLTACMARLAGKDIEISCDEDIVKAGDKQFKAEYAQTIVRVISMQNNKLILATNFSQNARTVKERFSTIFLSQKLKNGRTVMAAFLAAVIFATSFVGCTSSNVTSDVNANNFLSSTEKTRVARNVIGGDGLGKNEHPIEGNEWYFTYISENGDKFVAKYDLDAELSFVCSKDNCNHTGSECIAYIPEDNFYSFFTANNHIYALVYNSHPDKSVEILEISEQGRNHIASLNIINLDSVAISGQYLITSTAKSADESTTIIVDLVTGEVKEFEKSVNLPSSQNVVDLSPDGKTVYFRIETSAIGTRDIIAHNIETGEITTVQSLDYDDIIGEDGYWRQDYTVDDNVIYTVNLNTDTFSKRNLTVENSNETVLISNISEKLGNAQNVYCVGIYDNKLIVDITQNNGKKYGHPRPYAIDLETLEVLPLTNMIAKQSGGITTRCNIFGEIGNCFIISTGYDDEMTANIGIISKEDFFANNPQVLPLGKYRLF